MLPRTKIVATLGPASWEEAVLRQLLAEGVSVVRINFSHAEHETTAEKIALVRRLATELDKNVAILADLQGPRIRVGVLPSSGVMLITGTSVTLLMQPATELDAIPVDYAGLAADVEEGDLILLDDGLIALRVAGVDVEAGRIACKVLVGGVLTSHKGINVPARPLSVPTITQKDRVDLAFALRQGVDMVALSFVRSGADVAEARRLITGQTSRTVPVIAKIEKPSAVENFESILAEADGIMVARGDLGVEMLPEVLPGIQKRLIAAANVAAKPVITATQMLDSMIRNPRPTRAEATDVANAVLDGSDAVMLSGETASGKYPVEAVRTMARIAIEAEKLCDYGTWTERIAGMAGQKSLTMPEDTHDARVITEVLCRAADRIGDELQARAIIALTRSGTSARYIAKYRPQGTLLAVTDQLDTQRALAVTWGVHAMLLDEFGDTLSTLADAERVAVECGLIAPGDLLVFTGGLPLPTPGKTTLLKVQIAGEPPTP
ncbi:MAG TPA: pyruvate kinase [Chloroflexia bacterium]|nr:pyruvate kinase [Chloroflexia bacterium]